MSVPVTAAAAQIREEHCIGCALCLNACPVDAIVGAPQWMHSVITGQCIGCRLCLPPCPVDCIEMHAVPASGQETQQKTTVARERIRARNTRLKRERAQHQDAWLTAKKALKKRMEQKSRAAPPSATPRQ